MGDVVHELESRVNALTAAGEFPDTAAFVQMRGELDRLQAMHDQIRRGQAELLVSPSTSRSSVMFLWGPNIQSLQQLACVLEGTWLSA